MVLNETLNGTIETLDFETVTQITNNPIILTAIVVIWLLPIIIYLFIASVTHARTSSGKKLDSLMIQSANAWIPIIIWFFIQASLFLILLIFPLYLKLI